MYNCINNSTNYYIYTTVKANAEVKQQASSRDITTARYIPPTHVCELHSGGVAQDRAVVLAIAGVANQLDAPHPEILFHLGTLLEDSDG